MSESGDRAATIEVRLNDAQTRSEIFVDGELAGFVNFRRRGTVVTLPHAEIFPEFERRGLGSILVQRTLDDIRARGESVVPRCPFVKAWIDKHPAYQDLVA